jgi:hypothetical protein
MVEKKTDGNRKNFAQGENLVISTKWRGWD